ncbi:hypothetical protein DCAR_0310632 [Daucus carota subsp. sativus]|uniref:Uncharacterized protein n=1 Tax=Daucus carota subsp. sativus TaxID=79200 RepID=A0A166A243_DAUCS|nr:PREDICTED: dehydration-responsive element-binding protein 1E-like [Daucus carota subsp. sativus]WOG91383.1 hypothetical protein DCAR_0310632 [Daucus carota subsp. sativus]
MDQLSSKHDSEGKGKSIDSEGHNSYEVLLASRNPKKRSGRIKFKETRHPVYRGIRRRDSGKWVCEVREPIKNSRIWLGTYPTAEMAARANDVAAIALRGETACLNFEDSVWRLPLPESSDVKDIQIAAAKAAEAFRPPENEMMSGENTSLVVKEDDEMFDMDEDAIFRMPQLINNMAEGMLISPPQYVQSDGCDELDDDMEDATDLSLWSYSF